MPALFDWNAENADNTIPYWPTKEAEFELFEAEAVNNAVNNGDPLVKEIEHYLEKCIGCEFLSASKNFCLKGPMSKCDRGEQSG
jgi:hypothetical protein